MKLWVREATYIKRRAVRLGNHVKGMRYGGLAKAVTGAVHLKALPSALFINMAARVGIIDLDRKDDTLPLLNINGTPVAA